MTTIIYKDGQVATDSYTNNGSIVTDINSEKVHYAEGAMFFISGALSDYDCMIDAFFGRNCSVDGVELSALVWFDGCLFQCGISKKSGFWRQKLDTTKYYSVGSGYELAYGALDAGCNLVRACEIATQRDLFSGGEIKVYDLPGYEGK